MFDKPIYGFWISPEAVIYPITNEFGHRVFMEKFLNKEFETDDDCIKKTLDEGWIRVVNKREFIVNYKYLMRTDQLHALRKCVDIVESAGYFHNGCYLERNGDYYSCDKIDTLINKIKYWSC